MFIYLPIQLFYKEKKLLFILLVLAQIIWSRGRPVELLLDVH